MGNDPDIVDISSEITAADNSSSTGPDTGKSEPVRKYHTRKKKKWIKWVIILVIIAGIAVFAVIKVRETANKVKDAMSPTQQEDTIKRMDITSSISTTGTIQSKDVRTLTSPLAGVKIEKVNYKVGDMVNEGAIVVAFSVTDINKKIGQLEEDITEAKQAKALDSGDRNNTYVNGYDLQTYNVATAYDKLQKADIDLQKAKDDLQRLCDQKAEFKALHEEAKEKIEEVEIELKEKQEKYNNESLKEDPDEDELGKLQVQIDDLTAKITNYRSALGANYDAKITNFEEQEKTKFDQRDTAQRAYDSAYVDFNKAGYDAGFNNAKSDYNLNKGNLQANDTVKNLERQKEQNEDNLDNYIVTAPITGLVTSVNAEEGNGYQATTGALMTIQAVDVLEVTTQVDEYDINNVKLGQDVVIMTDGTGTDEFKGKVTFVAPTATVAAAGSTSSSNTFEVKIDILNKDDRLKLGMSAKINILMDTHKGVLAVPYDAIEQKDEGTTYINVLDTSAQTVPPTEKDKIDNILGIQVFGTDGKEKETDTISSEGKGKGKDKDKSKDAMPKNVKEIPVQVGLEGDFYTEVISPDIKEGMTVVINNSAGELSNDMDMFMGM